MWVSVVGPLIELLIIVLIVMHVRNKKKKKQEREQEQRQKNELSPNDQLKERLNQEILAELEKSDPDYDKLKELRAQMDNLSAETTTNIFEGSPQIQQDTNLNSLSIALLVGSLLILAGIGGLVSSGIQEVGLVLLILMTAAFYGGGLFIRKIDSLKIVSYVFVGTGMMILPFI